MLHAPRALRGGAIAGVVFSLLLIASSAQAQRPGTCKVLVLGFMGGLGTAHFPPSAATPLNHQIAALREPGFCFKIFSGFCPICGHRWMRKEFGAHFLKPLQAEQIALGPKVIVYGYSQGVPAALLFSRMLQRDGIPIEMVVTVDSKGFTEGIVPSNVKMAVNFYEQRYFPFFFGKRRIRCEDPGKTQFLGNIRVEHTGHFHLPNTPPVRDALFGAIHRAYGQPDRMGSAPTIQAADSIPARF
jgi:hypothetical protein